MGSLCKYQIEGVGDCVAARYNVNVIKVNFGQGAPVSGSLFGLETRNSWQGAGKMEGEGAFN